MRHVCNVVLLASVVEVVGIESGVCVVVMLDDDVTSVSFWGNTVASTVGDVVLLEIIVVDVSTVLLWVVRVDVATGAADELVLLLLLVLVVLMVVGVVVVVVLVVVVVVLVVPRLGPRFGNFEVATVVLRVVVVLMLDLLVVLITTVVVLVLGVVVADDVCTSTTVVVVVVVDVFVEFWSNRAGSVAIGTSGFGVVWKKVGGGVTSAVVKSISPGKKGVVPPSVVNNGANEGSGVVPSNQGGTVDWYGSGVDLKSGMVTGNEMGMSVVNRGIPLSVVKKSIASVENICIGESVVPKSRIISAVVGGKNAPVGVVSNISNGIVVSKSSGGSGVWVYFWKPPLQ
jgi:hypothetical protein